MPLLRPSSFLVAIARCPAPSSFQESRLRGARVRRLPEKKINSLDIRVGQVVPKRLWPCCSDRVLTIADIMDGFESRHETARVLR